MDRLAFEELELQARRSGLPLKSFLQQAGVSYSTYRYWHKKCSAGKENANPRLAPIRFRRPAAGPSSWEQMPQGVVLLFPGGLRAHFGSGSEKILTEVLNQLLQDRHV